MSWLKQKLLGGPSVTPIKRRSFRFQRLLKNYGRILELLDDVAEKQGGGFVLDKQYLVASTNKLFDLADTMVYDLNVLTREQHLDFYDMLDRFKKETRELISDPAFLQSELVIPLPGAKEFLPQHLGSKNASLLDLHHQLGITVPEGFAITYSAHQRIIETNRLGDLIKSAIDKFQKNDPVATKELLAVQEKLRSATIPSELRKEVDQALNIMTEKFGNDLILTMDFTIRGKRLDCKGNGSDYTKTISTIQPDKVCDLYRDEITNLYAPAQVYFRQMKRMDGTAYLAAVFKRMIRGKAAGKLYTLDPASPFSNFMVLTIRANRDDQNAPREKYRVSRHSPWEIIPLQNKEDKRQKKNDISSLSTGQQDDGCVISYDAIATLIKLGLRIERYFQQAQEIDWIQNDDDDSFIISQVQPLEKTSIASIDRKALVTTLKKYRVLYDNVGTVACRGIGCGPVFLANYTDDLKEFPEQGVLVISDSFPDEAQTQIMQSATAILIDSGKSTEPMVSHARYFHIPCIIGLGDVTKRLASGTIITVDADENVVYEGQIDELVNYHLIEGLGYEDVPEYQMFQIIQDKITPLTLTNLANPEFTIRACQTMHDLTHLAYENAVMVISNQELYRREFLPISNHLTCNHNLSFQIIDIGDGLKQEKSSGSVIGINALQCRPLLVLWEAFGAPDKKGDSLLPYADFGPNCVNTALVSKEYLNLVMHLENLTDMIDCFICEENDLNYIFCRFSARAHQNGLTILSQEVMRRLDLKVEKTSKALHAWLSGLAPQAMEERLRFIGHLIVFTRIADQRALKNMPLEDQCNFFFHHVASSNII
jgi:pyruvate, water dikinase